MATGRRAAIVRTAAVAALTVVGATTVYAVLSPRFPALQRAPASPPAAFTACRLADASSPAGPPSLVRIPLPTFPGAAAIWGSVGRHSSGHIWFGVSASGVPSPSAHLFEYEPETAVLHDRGDVLAQLKRLGLDRPGEGQGKIHSRIVQGPDGFLYFASLDEDGERDDGSRLPTWGGHLWRIKPGSNVWEHLLATREALIAVAAAGTRIYALGYFDHVLYQFNTATGRVQSVHVGARGGHVSRNFAVDQDGHAYVPRLAADAADATKLRTTLVEFDESLRQVAETPIGHYTQAPDESSHGLVGIQYLADHSIALATDRGFLYRVVPRLHAAAEVVELGSFHPGGEAYVSSMFTDDGRSHLMGASRRQWNGDNRYEWLVFDLVSRTSVAFPLEIPREQGLPLDGLLLYGSMACDNAGRGYLLGTYSRDGRLFPVVLQAQAGATPR